MGQHLLSLPIYTHGIIFRIIIIIYALSVSLSLIRSRSLAVALAHSLSLSITCCRSRSCSHSLPLSISHARTRALSRFLALSFNHTHARSPSFLFSLSHSINSFRYRVATTSRLLKITGLFNKRTLLKRLYSTKKPYNLIDPTNQSQRILCLKQIVLR